MMLMMIDDNIGDVENKVGDDQANEVDANGGGDANCGDGDNKVNCG